MEKIETTERLAEMINNIDIRLSKQEKMSTVLHSSHESFKKNLASQCKYTNKLKVALAKTIIALGVVSVVSLAGLGMGIHSMSHNSDENTPATGVETEYGQLLNCPLCGGEVSMNSSVYSDYTTAWVKCKECRLEQHYHEADTLSEAEKEAAEDWNKRAEVNIPDEE